MDLAGQRVLVTGADGFIGSHLSEQLLAKGARVVALSFYNSLNHWGWLEDVPCLGQLEVVPGDIRDGRFVRTLTRGVDVIFHLAALIAIPYSYSAPESYVGTNVHGTLNLLQAALDNGVKRFVHASSSEVYGTARRVPMDEEHPLRPQSPYSATKIGADALATSFFHAYGLPVAIARPFNAYGPRQSARAIIPTIITQLLSDEGVIGLGNLAPTRDFTYVEDTCRGLIAVAECDAALGETLNIGSDTEISIGQLMELIQELAGRRAQVSIDNDRVRPQASEVERLRCDATKLRSLTGFSTLIDLREGLRRTLDWFRRPDNLRRYKAQIFNV